MSNFLHKSKNTQENIFYRIRWKNLSLFLLLIWFFLAMIMICLRVISADIRPALRQVQIMNDDLSEERDVLELEIQKLHNPVRIRTWAEDHAMIPFTKTKKTATDFTKIPLIEAKPGSFSWEYKTLGDEN